MNTYPCPCGGCGGGGESRGLLVESAAGPVWLVGTSTSTEHCARYPSQFNKTQNLFAGQIRTKTPYP